MKKMSLICDTDLLDKNMVTHHPVGSYKTVLCKSINNKNNSLVSINKVQTKVSSIRKNNKLLSLSNDLIYEIISYLGLNNSYPLIMTCKSFWHYVKEYIQLPLFITQPKIRYKLINYCDSIELIQWARDNGYPWKWAKVIKIFKIVAKNGNREDLKWLCNHKWIDDRQNLIWLYNHKSILWNNILDTRIYWYY
jgi:hypothetical protein